MKESIKGIIEYRMTRGYGLDLKIYKSIDTALREFKIIYNKKTKEFIEK